MCKPLQYSSLIILIGIFLFQSAFCQDPSRFQHEIDRFKADTIDYLKSDNLVLFTGSSSVRMWIGLETDFQALHVLNRGFGGSHMSDLLYYADPVILQCRPSEIVIYEGDNDIASGEKPEHIIAEAAKLIQVIREKLPHSVIYFISAKPSIARWNLKETYQDFNRRLKELTLQYRNTYYISVWDRMLDADGSPRSDLFLEDNLHMNRKGYDIWKEVAEEFLTFKRSAPPSGFGVCTSLSNARQLKEIGYGYVEGSVQRDLVPAGPDSLFIKNIKEFEACFLPVLACNSFLPGALKVTGPNARPDAVLHYAEVAFRRAASVGVRIIVFGSGGARSIPEGFDRDQARRQFVSLLKEMGPIARKYGIMVAIENLQKSETNFINTFAEGLAVAQEVNDPNIRVLADIFHMMREGEKPEILEEAGTWLVHCHVAELKDRTAPGMTGDDFRPYFEALKRIGYGGGISIEGSWKMENLYNAFRELNVQWRSIL